MGVFHSYFGYTIVHLKNSSVNITVVKYFNSKFKCQHLDVEPKDHGTNNNILLNTLTSRPF